MQEIQAARTSGTKRPEEEGANVNSESKRPREDDDDKEEEEPGRRYTDWLQIWSHMCKLEDETDLKPMRYTDEPSDHNDFTPCLEVFSVKVSELEGWLEWPVDVFGFIAVRDTLDRKRNFIFKRDDLDPQTLTSEDSSLVLTGPCRAVELLGIVDFEIELKIKGNRQSENKTFISDYLQYDPGGRSDFDSIVQMETCSGKRGTIAVTFAHLTAALEATIQIKVISQSSDFHGQFVACTDRISEEVMLLDSRDGMVVVTADHTIKLSRRVVAVKRTGKLKLAVRAWKDDNETVGDHADFSPLKYGRSLGKFNVGFCEMEISVAWSLIS